jgi:5-methylcytosine-specific restriction endonuclease McrA
MKVYASDRETIEYWRRRKYKNALSQIYSAKVGKIYTRQKGICPCCRQPVTDISETHIHHMLPVKYGGTEKLNNLWLLHLDCHMALHSEYSLEQMRDAARNGRWYLPNLLPKVKAV